MATFPLFHTFHLCLLAVFSQWAITVSEKPLLLFLLSFLPSCCHGALRWQHLRLRHAFDGNINLETQYANTVLSMRARGCWGQAAGAAGKQKPWAEYLISTYHFLCVFSPPSKGLWHRGAVREVCAKWPSFGKCAGRCGVRAPFHARRWAPTPKGKRTPTAAWNPF